MIRAGMPLPPALRLRLRLDAAAEGIAYRIRTVRKRFVTVARNEVAELQSLPRLNGQLSTDMRSMQEFVSRYDDLVDLLCWTAKEGVSDLRRARYDELRSWFVDNYDPVRADVTRHLDSRPEDREPVAVGTPAPRDAFESLFLPSQIDTLINSDAVIHRIMRTRYAVEACREEMTQEQGCALVG